MKTEKSKTASKNSRTMKNIKTASKTDGNTPTIKPHGDKKCTDNFCKKYVARQTKKTEKFIKDMVNHFAKKEDKTRVKSIYLASIKKSLSKLKSKKDQDKMLETCKETFCNPTCKGTIFQDDNLPKEVLDKINNNKDLKDKDKKMLIEMVKNTRKNIFKNKKTVLKDGFYEELENVDKLKKEGATSGCTLFVMK